MGVLCRIGGREDLWHRTFTVAGLKSVMTAVYTVTCATGSFRGHLLTFNTYRAGRSYSGMISTLDLEAASTSIFEAGHLFGGIGATVQIGRFRALWDFVHSEIVFFEAKFRRDFFDANGIETAGQYPRILEFFISWMAYEGGVDFTIYIYIIFFFTTLYLFYLCT